MSPNLLKDLGTCRLTLYVTVMALVSALAYGSLSNVLLDSDDASYLRDAATVGDDLALVVSSERAMTGRPLVELLFLGTHAVWGSDPAAYHLLLVALHCIASLLLACLFRRLGAGTDISLAASLLFLINVAHFRAIQWISCVAYPLALIFAISTILIWVRYLRLRDSTSLAAANAALLLAVLSHPAAMVAAPFCAYVSLRHCEGVVGAIKATWSPMVLASMATGALVLCYPNATQLNELVDTPTLHLMFLHFLGYVGQLFTYGHWLPQDIWGADTWLEYGDTWNRLAGLIAAVGLVIVLLQSRDAPRDWAVWSVLAMLPFLIREPVGASRYLYFASAGSSLLLAWSIRTLVTSLAAHRCRPAMIHGMFAAALLVVTTSSVFALKRAEALALYYSGRSYIASGDLETGVAQLRRALSRDAALLPDNVYARLSLSAFTRGESPKAVLVRAASDGRGGAQARALLGAAVFQSDNRAAYAGGLKQIERAIAHAENEGDVRRITATAFHNMGTHALHIAGDPEPATGLFRKALDFESNYPSALLSLGSALALRGETPAAMDAFERTIESDPSCAAAYENLAILKANRGDHRAASALLHQAIGLTTDGSRPWFLLARLHRAVGRSDAAYDAIRRLETTGATQSEHWAEYLLIAADNHRAGNLTRALAMYRTATEVLPHDAGTYQGLGLVCYDSGRYEEAVAAFRMVLRLTPDDVGARASLALVSAAAARVTEQI